MDTRTAQVQGSRGIRDGGQFIAGGLVRTDVTAAAAKEMMGGNPQLPCQILHRG